MKLDEPRAIVLGLMLVALAILAVGLLGPRYELVKWGDGPRFVRFNKVTGQGVICQPTRDTWKLECGR